MSEGMKISTSDFVYNYLMGRPSILKKKGGMGFKIRYSLPIKYRLSGKESVCQCRRRRFDPWVRKIPEGRNSNPFQHYGLRNLMDRGGWWATVQGVAKSQTQLRAHTLSVEARMNL